MLLFSPLLILPVLNMMVFTAMVIRLFLPWFRPLKGVVMQRLLLVVVGLLPRLFVVLVLLVLLVRSTQMTITRA